MRQGFVRSDFYFHLPVERRSNMVVSLNITSYEHQLLFRHMFTVIYLLCPPYVYFCKRNLGELQNFHKTPRYKTYKKHMRNSWVTLKQYASGEFEKVSGIRLNVTLIDMYEEKTYIPPTSEQRQQLMSQYCPQTKRQQHREFVFSIAARTSDLKIPARRSQHLKILIKILHVVRMCNPDTRGT